MRAADPTRVVAEARLWLGTPYRHQGSLRGIGCDCLGLVRGVWRGLLGDEPEAVPAYTPFWAELEACCEKVDTGLSKNSMRQQKDESLLYFHGDTAGSHSGEPLLAMAQRHLLPAPPGEITPGTVLLFRWRAGLPAKHCGIASAPGQFIHAHDGAAVAEVPLPALWQRRLAGCFLFPERIQ